MQKEEKDFKERWIAFIRVIFDPWAIALYILIVALIVFYGYAKEDYVKILLTFLFSIISSLIGGVYTKRWSDINEEKIVFAKGTTAIRSLKLLLQQIISVENRTRLFLKRNNKNNSEESVKIGYEEIIDRCKLLEEQAIGAIENWNDIIPEADVKTQIGMISELKQREEELEKRIENMTEQKLSSDKQNDAKDFELQKAKNDLEKLRTELRAKEERLNLSGLSGIASASVVVPTTFKSLVSEIYKINKDTEDKGKLIASAYINSQSKKCKGCGDSFVPTKGEEFCSKCLSNFSKK